MANPISKVITGGRAVVSIDSGTGPQVIGIFDSVSTSESLSTEDIHILGRYSPTEITVTSYNSVSVNCSGFRVYGHGVKVLGAFPTLNALLKLGPVTLSIKDRENDKGNSIATIFNCVPESNSNNYSARSTSKINITYKGTYMVDESNPTDSEAGATDLP